MGFSKNLMWWRRLNQSQLTNFQHYDCHRIWKMLSHKKNKTKQTTKEEKIISAWTKVSDSCQKQYFNVLLIHTKERERKKGNFLYANICFYRWCCRGCLCWVFFSSPFKHIVVCLADLLVYSAYFCVFNTLNMYILHMHETYRISNKWNTHIQQGTHTRSVLHSHIGVEIYQ